MEGAVERGGPPAPSVGGAAAAAHGQEAERWARALPAAAARAGAARRLLMGTPGGRGGGRAVGAARADGGVLSRQLHASEVVAERGPELRSAPEQSPLEEFLATAELAGTRFVAGEQLGRAWGCGWGQIRG